MKKMRAAKAERYNPFSDDYVDPVSTIKTAVAVADSEIVASPYLMALALALCAAATSIALVVFNTFPSVANVCILAIPAITMAAALNQTSKKMRRS